MSRILTYAGGGSARSVFSTQTVGNLELEISNALIANGWGISTFNLSWSTLNFSPYLYYKFQLTINTPQNENAERVKQGIANTISQYLDNVTVQLTGDNTGQAQVVDNSVLGSASQLLFGDNNPKTTATILGLSTGTALAIGIGIIALIALRSPTSPIRYLRR